MVQSNMRLSCILLVIAILCVSAGQAANVSIENGAVVFSGDYDPTIPTPESILGYSIGERFTDYRNLEQYIFALAEASDRVFLYQYGTSYQRRPLRVLFFSSPENLTNLRRIKEANLRLTDPRTITDRAAAELMRDVPVIVWLAYNVHGSEASGTEAAILTMYHLAASRDPGLAELLAESVIVLDPVANPDGRERYVQFINSHSQRIPNPDPQSLEHSEPWPRGRTNHYYFDLNRDWAWLTQKETRYRVQLYRRIMPHVYIDFHEMGRESTYFFFPATPPIHPNYPEEIRVWWQKFGRGNAAALDNHGIPYYTGEVFDLFYPGYGDSWPTLNGAIGMTYEQSGGSTGRAFERNDNHILTLAERARNHFLTGIATIETAHRNKHDLLQYFYTYWKTGISRSHNLEIKSIILTEGTDPNRTADLVNLLLMHGIEVHRLTRERVIRNVRPFFSKHSIQREFKAGTYVVNLNQPQSRLAQTLLEPYAELPDTFFFDITAWSLPAAYNVDAFMSESFITRDLEQLTEPVIIEGGVTGHAQYAYLIPWERDKAAAVLWELLQREYVAHFASRSFTQQGRQFLPGTIILYTHRNPSSLHETIRTAARKHNVVVYATDTGMSEKGIDLGSNHVHPVLKPRIALASNRPTIPNEYGELWFLFDEVYGIPFTPFRTEDLRDIDLSRYDVLILPNDGNGTGYRSTIDSVLVEDIRRWVRNGGILITIAGASQFATKDMSGLTTVQRFPRGESDESSAHDEQDRRERLKRMGFRERQEYFQRERIAGALFKVHLDLSHPLAFGYERDIIAIKRGTHVLQLTANGYNVGVFSDGNVLSGYAHERLAENVRDTAFLIDYPIGNGRVVMFNENPHFRMFWHGLTKMFLNAILFLR